MKQAQVEIRGISPIIPHNGQTADPLNSYARNLKEISSKRKKTDDDHYAMSKIEWQAGLYVREGTAELIIPSENIEAMLSDAAAKVKGITKKDAVAAFWCEGDANLIVPDWDESDVLANYEFGGRFVMRKLVRVQNSKVARTRPICFAWSAEFVVNFDEEICDQRTFKQLLEIASNRIGLCDWRPKFGRFEIIKLDIS